MRRESRVRDLRDLDFLALVLGLGLLVLLFRQIERWLHQHIFKVGWLLTNNFQITTVLYYIVFLPGILLHELTLWLAAGIFNVQAEGALQFPEEQDISELRLSFIRLATDTSTAKQILIRLSPLASGLAALWAISVTLFPGSHSTTLTFPGSVNELGAAIRSLTMTGDFWLWLYVVFTIANRCFPALPMMLSARRKIVLMLALPALCFGLWRASDAANPAIAFGMEGLLSGLTLIIAQITLLNIGCVLVLGVLEALIERFTNRSASFRDGRMMTHDGGEKAVSQASQRQGRRAAANASAARQAAPVMSIYDLKLPIPGPPGREPVSRQAVAVVNLQHSAAVLNQEIAARPKPIPTVVDEKDESALDSLNLMSDESVGGSGRAAANHDAVAPFARPFSERDAPGSASDTWDEVLDESDGEPFARPFVMPTRTNLPASVVDAVEAKSDRAKFDALDIDAANANVENSAGPDDTRHRSGHTRPAPKPSQKHEREIGSGEPPGPEELVYEDLDEVDAYDQGDGSYEDGL